MLEWIPGQADQRALEQALLPTGTRAWSPVLASMWPPDMVPFGGGWLMGAGR